MPPRKTSAPSSSIKPLLNSDKPPSVRRSTSLKSLSKSDSKPATSVKPISRRGGDTSSTLVPFHASQPTIFEHDAVHPRNGGRPNGHVEEEVESQLPSRRGRMTELVGEGKTSGRRRSSMGVVMKNHIPRPPPPSRPHKALFIFGTGDMGQFGLGPDELDEIARPKLHSWFEEQIEEGRLSRDGTPHTGGLEAVACGGMHTLAVDEGGRVRSWGINDNAALGRITTDVQDPKDPSIKIPNEDLETVPFIIESLEKEGFRAVQVAAGDSVSVAVSDKGKVRAWGSFRSNDGILGFDGVAGHSPFQFHPIALPSLEKAKVEVVGSSCGENHVLALTTTGHVYVWGGGQQSQLGRRIIERRKLNGLEPERLGLRNIVLVSAGMYHSFAIDVHGTVWAWGLNTFHQTGLSPSKGGDDDMVIVPAQVEALSPEKHSGARVVQIEGGEHHSIFLFDNGEVWGCGRCDAHQLGLAEDHPAFEGIKKRRVEIIRAKQTKVDAALQKVESANGGEIGEEAEKELSAAQASLSAALDEFVPEPVRICFPPIPETYEVVPPFPSYAESKPSDNPISQISAGTRHNLAVSRSGHVYSWGLGIQAQLGLGQQESAEVPTLVRSKSLRPYTALSVSAGGQHCVLLARLTEEADGMVTDA